MLEIILGIAGVWILISGKVPGWIIGKKGYEILGTPARIVGLVLSLPFPVSLVAGFLLGMFFGKDGVIYAYIFELVTFLTDLVIVMVLIRKFRTPIPSAVISQ